MIFSYQFSCKSAVNWTTRKIFVLFYLSHFYVVFISYWRRYLCWHCFFDDKSIKLIKVNSFSENFILFYFFFHEWFSIILSKIIRLKCAHALQKSVRTFAKLNFSFVFCLNISFFPTEQLDFRALNFAYMYVLISLNFSPPFHIY